MKTLLITLSLFACGIRFASAQEQTTTDLTLTEQLKKLCDLSPEQIAKVQPIVNDFEKKRDYIYKRDLNNPILLTKEVKKNRWDYEVSLIGILTPEQMGLLKAFDQLNTPIMTGALKPNYEPIYIARAR